MKISNIKYSIIRKIEGFTLTELIVAMSLFIVGMTLTVGAFVNTLKTQRIVTHLMSVNSNASLVLEQMAREIRTGYDFNLINLPGGFCPGPSQGEIQFTNAKNNQVTYRSENNEILRQECFGVICSGANFDPITATDVSVDRLCFAETQQQVVNPWRITMFLRVGSTNPQLNLNFINLQTTITSRILPCDVFPLPQCA